MTEKISISLEELVDFMKNYGNLQYVRGLIKGEEVAQKGISSEFDKHSAERFSVDYYLGSAMRNEIPPKIIERLNNEYPTGILQDRFSTISFVKKSKVNSLYDSLKSFFKIFF